MSTKAQQSDLIKPDDSVREVLARYPEAVVVFDRHGLAGCGGPQGPVEPVAFFAAVHHVDAQRLLHDLNEFVASLEAGSAAEPQAPAAREAEAPPLYPRFLKASLLVAVGGGFSLGLWALLRAASGVPTAPLSWAELVQAHGQAQLWGFVGLFIMGVAYHAVPRFRGVRLAGVALRLAALSFWLTLAGVLLRLAFLAVPGWWAYPVLAASALLLALGTACFGWAIIRTLRQGQRGELYEGYLEAGIAWLGVAALHQVIAAAYLWAAGGRVLPARLDEPLLTAFLLGFVVLTVLGVSARTLPVFLGLRASRPALLRAALWLLSPGVAAVALALGLSDDLTPALSRWLLLAGQALVLAGVLAFVAGLRLLEPRASQVPDLAAQNIPRSFQDFVRAAYVWLLAAAAIWAFLALRAAAFGQGTLMTESSAGRHALALGFVTLMVMGMATRIVPVFRGSPLFSAGMQRAAFWLVLASVTPRVAVELGWGYGSRLDPLLSASGVLGFLGMALFAANVWLTLEGRTLLRPAQAPPAPEAGVGPIGPRTPLSEVVARVPDALRLLSDHGLYMLRDPEHRQAALRTLDLEQAARMSRVDVAPLVDALRRAEAGEGPGARVRADMLVAEVLARYPRTLEVFLAHGFTPLANPAMREKLAATVTVAQAAQLRGVALGPLLDALNQAAREDQP